MDVSARSTRLQARPYLDARVMTFGFWKLRKITLLANSIEARVRGALSVGVHSSTRRIFHTNSLCNLRHRYSNL